MTFREPLGVVGLIVPWNFPLAIASWKVAPALAAGNTIVLKPAELTPLTALELERIALEAGLPEGVLNVVAGPGSVCGKRLVEHPDVAKIAFTGSTEVGRGIAAGRRRHDQARDARAGRQVGERDLRRRRPGAGGRRGAAGRVRQRGPGLLRALAHPGRALRASTDFLEALEREVRAMRVGDPLDEATQMGPLISADQRETVASYVPDDAPVAIRGSAPDGPGYWFPPTVLAPVSNADRAAAEEIFGPVACVIPFADEHEAVAIANDTIYGLSGSIWTRDGGTRPARRARDRDRRAVDQLEQLGARHDAVRRLQAVRASGASSGPTRSSTTPT